MELEFNKKNLVYLLLVLNAHRSEGQFLGVLLERVRKSVDAHNAAQRGSDGRIPDYARLYQPISRSTLFNYLGALRAAFPDGYEVEKAEGASGQFCAEHPRMAVKFFKKFNPVSFEACADFLIQGGFLKPAHPSSALANAPNGLFFAMQNFLGVSPAAEQADAGALCGSYQVYRPSLMMPGKVIVSAALIQAQSDGALSYEELMHFKSPLGWRRQLLSGYVLTKSGRMLIITRDSNTGFAQHTLLKPMFRGHSYNGQGRIESLAGLYSGATNNTASGLFSTGIFLARREFRSLQNHPLHRWKVGHLQDFGLVEPDSLSQRIRGFLNPHADS